MEKKDLLALATKFLSRRILALAGVLYAALQGVSLPALICLAAVVAVYIVCVTYGPNKENGAVNKVGPAVVLLAVVLGAAAVVPAEAAALAVPESENTAIPAIYGGMAYDSKVGLTSAGVSDVFGSDRFGLYAAVGALERRGPCIGLSADVQKLVELIHLDYKWLDKLKLAGGGSYSFTETDWSWFAFGAVISLDF